MSDHNVVFEFPDLESRNTFMGWFSDGGGESEYMDSSEIRDDKPINKITYPKRENDTYVIKCGRHPYEE